MWDYNIGLVRMTPFFKSLGYPKVDRPDTLVRRGADVLNGPSRRRCWTRTRG